MRPNNSFNPNPLRSTNKVADKACHVVGSTTQVGLTQALGVATIFRSYEFWTVIAFIMTVAAVAAIFAAFEIRKSTPQLRGTWDSYSGIFFWPSWVLHFVTPARLSALSRKARKLVLLSIACYLAGISSLILGVTTFLAAGGSL